MSSSARLGLFVGICLAALSPTGCIFSGSATPTPSELPMERDVHSYARPDECRVTHIALDLVADFDAKTLRGTARLAVTRAANAGELWLDTDGLTIDAVRGPHLAHAARAYLLVKFIRASPVALCAQHRGQPRRRLEESLSFD